MIRNDILKLAREAKLPYYYQDGELVDVDKVIKFAALVAAAEREACARVCEVQPAHSDWEDFAAAIRARGEKE